MPDARADSHGVAVDVRPDSRGRDRGIERAQEAGSRLGEIPVDEAAVGQSLEQLLVIRRVGQARSGQRVVPFDDDRLLSPGQQGHARLAVARHLDLVLQQSQHEALERREPAERLGGRLPVA